MKTIVVSPAEWNALTGLKLLGGSGTAESVAHRIGQPESKMLNALRELKMRGIVTSQRVRLPLRRRGGVSFRIRPGIRVVVNFERVNPSPVRRISRKDEARPLRLTVAVSHDEAERVKAAAATQGVSVSEYIRKSLPKQGAGGEESE